MLMGCWFRLSRQPPSGWDAGGRRPATVEATHEPSMPSHPFPARKEMHVQSCSAREVRAAGIPSIVRIPLLALRAWMDMRASHASPMRERGNPHCGPTKMLLVMLVMLGDVAGPGDGAVSMGGVDVVIAHKNLRTNKAAETGRSTPDRRSASRGRRSRSYRHLWGRVCSRAGS